jgi:hypothetical protein
MGLIITVLAVLPALTGGVMRVMVLAGTTIGGVGGLLLATKIDGTRSLGSSIVIVVASAVVLTVFVLLCWLAVEAIARRRKREQG